MCRFPGEVVEFNGVDKHRILYDDGDEDWYNLAKEKVKLQPSKHIPALLMLCVTHHRQMLITSIRWVIDLFRDFGKGSSRTET